MPVAAPDAPIKISARSMLLFTAGAILLRLVAVGAWAFFPGDRLVPKLVQVAVPLVSVAGLMLLNRALLSRDGFPPDSLGLRPTPTRLGWFLVGAIAITVIVAMMVGVLALLVPFQYARGPMSASQLLWRSAVYFGGNWGEELMFRGYLLLVAARRFGVPSALIFTGLLFGLFHLPGLSGVVALKMGCTTFLAGCLYAYGYLLTGTVWTAAGLHVAGNVVLHHVFGASNQSSLFVPVYERPWPTSYDPAFVAWLAVFIPVIAIAALVARRRRPSVRCEAISRISARSP